MRRNGCRQRKRKTLGELSADADSRRRDAPAGRASASRAARGTRTRTRLRRQRTESPARCRRGRRRSEALRCRRSPTRLLHADRGRQLAGGTTARVAPTVLAPKKTSPVPSMSAITGTTQNTGRPRHDGQRTERQRAQDVGREHDPPARPASAATPATSPSSGSAGDAKRASPAFAGECVRESATAGSEPRAAR